MKNIIAIAVGGAIGALARFSINMQAESPVGTIIENISGSFLLGILTAYFLIRLTKEWLRLGLGVGLCGGFTTMSTLAFDSVFLFQMESFFVVLLYLLITIFGGIIFAFLGFFLGNKLAEIQINKAEGTE
ncbi:fluoride efflux transporter FluC [Saliterribacillus persicus]|uniref:Fluoride-specific ion channel FluC n=1 Tax=Saliterribacillus persicus TaxID=930114 RepID=A0A368X4V6_9BACI|nr:CrcB family protein [Saliterribacillus persicus]RCW62973.1 CrcB protein [Saliterribacillus persicus]